MIELKTKTAERLVPNFTYDELQEMLKRADLQQELQGGDVRALVFEDIERRLQVNSHMRKLLIADKMASMFEEIDFNLKEVCKTIPLFENGVPPFNSISWSNICTFDLEECPHPEWAAVVLGKYSVQDIRHRTWNNATRERKEHRAGMPLFPLAALELLRRAKDVVKDRGDFLLFFKPDWKEYTLPQLDPVLLCRLNLCRDSWEERTTSYNDPKRSIRWEDHWYKIAQWGDDSELPND